jgi:hypothetical protein
MDPEASNLHGRDKHRTLRPLTSTSKTNNSPKVSHLHRWFRRGCPGRGGLWWWGRGGLFALDAGGKLEPASTID